MNLTKIEALFDRYANNPNDDAPSKDVMGPNGVLRLLNDLGVDPADRAVLIFAWKLEATVQCEFKRGEWMRGLTQQRVDSLDGLRRFMANSGSKIYSPIDHRAFYVFTFMYAKPASSRVLPIDVAAGYWRIIFGITNARVNDWIAFLESKKRGVNRDEWILFFDFLNTIKGDFSNYDPYNAWPVIFDEYVESRTQQPASE